MHKLLSLTGIGTLFIACTPIDHSSVSDTSGELAQCHYTSASQLLVDAQKALDELAGFDPTFFAEEQYKEYLLQNMKSENQRAKEDRAATIERFPWSADIFADFDSLRAHPALNKITKHDLAHLKVVSSDDEVCDADSGFCMDLASLLVKTNETALSSYMEKHSSDPDFARRALLSVWGHEIGHVVAHHYFHRQNIDVESVDGIAHHMLVDGISIILNKINHKDFIESLHGVSSEGDIEGRIRCFSAFTE